MLHNRFGICLIGYVIMPEHVHIVLYPHQSGTEQAVPISKLLYAFKKHVGFHGKVALRQVWQADGQLCSSTLNAWATGEFGSQSIRTTRGYDFNIYRYETLQRTFVDLLPVLMENGSILKRVST